MKIFKQSVILLPLISGLAFSGLAQAATVKGVVDNHLPVTTTCEITTSITTIDSNTTVSPSGNSTVKPQDKLTTSVTYANAGSEIDIKLATEKITLTTGGKSIFVGTIKYKIGLNNSGNGRGLYAQWVPQNSNNYASFIKVSMSKKGSNGKIITIRHANNETTSCI